MPEKIYEETGTDQPIDFIEVIVTTHYKDKDVPKSVLMSVCKAACVLTAVEDEERDGTQVKSVIVGAFNRHTENAILETLQEVIKAFEQQIEKNMSAGEKLLPKLMACKTAPELESVLGVSAGTLSSIHPRHLFEFLDYVVECIDSGKAIEAQDLAKFKLSY